MDFNSIQIQVFVSCPQDVNREKKIVKELCDVVSKDLYDLGYKVQLQFLDFSHIIGQIGTKPQQIINDKIVGYDVYLGILHTRFGSTTGNINSDTGKEFQSGTQEEFIHAKRQKILKKEAIQIYFFFKNDIKVKDSKHLKQIKKVLDFKDEIMHNDWVNNFKTKTEFERKIHSLLTRIGINAVDNHKIEAKQTVIKNNLGTINFAEESGLNNNFLVPKFIELNCYLARSITHVKEGNKELQFFKEETETLFLKDALVKEKKIVLLGNAGSGKSVELQQTAKYFESKDTPYIPVYKRFNTYVDEDIEEFLPSDWKKIQVELLVIFLDGLDEVQPQYFNIAVRKLLSFSNDNPNLRLVISSRTNFYELPSSNFSGTLTGFQVYILNDVSLSDVKEYATKYFQIDGDKFIQDIYQSTFLDLVQKPFFLNILLKYYKQNHNLLLSRASIIEESIISMIEFDKEHFNTTIDIQKTKHSILSLLEKVAFVMELTGRNFISHEELEIILPESNQINQIKYFSAFSKNAYKSQWMFEHNNIQEFLASRILERQSFEQLIKIISFAPSHKKLKPTWVNTISFFISTGENTLVSKLINWLLKVEHEILVKFEPDRISQNLRIEIFKRIFNFYKDKNIWLNSNKFSGNELSRFAASDDIIQFLINEISNQSNTNIVRLNAIHVLDFYDLNEFKPAFKENAKEILLSILDDEEPGANMIYSILSGLGKMGITDSNTIKYVVEKYKRRKNQYVRAGLYSLINKSTFLDEYIDLYVDGLQLNEFEEGINDRDSVNLADESWHLESGLKKVKSPETLKKILVFFNPKRKDLMYHNQEIFDFVLDTTFKAYEIDPSLYGNIYDIYINERWYYQNKIIPKIIEFLEQKNMKWQFLKKIWDDESINVIEKDFLLEPLIDKNTLNSFFSEFEKRNFTKDDALKIHGLVFWHNINERIGEAEISQFENKIKDISNLILERPKRIDWTTINKTKNQRSFNLLFDKNAMLNEIQNVFKEIEKDELQNKDLWELKKTNFQLLDESFASSALDILRDFTNNGRNVNCTQISKWITENTNYNFYQIREIYQDLKRLTNEISISIEQKIFIEDWCYDTSRKIDLKKAIHYKEGDKKTVSTNRSAQYLWFFINYFNLKIDNAKLLDYTLFYDFENHQKEGETAVIQKIESFVDKSLIEKRVNQNILEGIEVSYVWKSNALYSINNNLKSAFPYILRDLKDSNREYYRSDVLQAYFNRTHNISALQSLLKEISTDVIRWSIVNLLIKENDQHEFLITYFKNILQKEHELYDDKLKAAEYLMQLNQIDGLTFVANIIFKDNNPAFDFNFRLQTMPSLKTIDAIPILLKLLKISKQPEFETDTFNSLSSIVFNTFYSIGIQSESNFLKVKEALENFIEVNQNRLRHLNFIHFNIQRIEEQLYLNKSQSYTVEKALDEYTTLAN